MLISVSELACSQGGFSLGIPEWAISAGEFCVLLGRNGAGKSTLLKVLAGDLQAEGEILLLGKPLADWPYRDRARQVAVLPQASELNFAFVAEEVVALGAIPLELHWRSMQQAVHLAMVQADCTDLKGKPYPQLSGGEKQRVHFARVLLQLSQAEQPPLLLLDEPTSAQDLKQQHHILKQAVQLSRDKDYGVLAVLHDLNQALGYAHRCTLMQDGRIVADGQPDAVLTPEKVSEHWGHPVSYATTASGQRLLC